MHLGHVLKARLPSGGNEDPSSLGTSRLYAGNACVKSCDAYMECLSEPHEFFFSPSSKYARR